VLCKEEAEADPVVQWIRAEFSNLDKVPHPAHTCQHGEDNARSVRMRTYSLCNIL
jgi:hypothetical protein